jgi:hypothetical protein
LINVKIELWKSLKSLFLWIERSLYVKRKTFVLMKIALCTELICYQIFNIIIRTSSSILSLLYFRLIFLKDAFIHNNVFSKLSKWKSLFIFNIFVSCDSLTKILIKFCAFFFEIFNLTLYLSYWLTSLKFVFLSCLIIKKNNCLKIVSFLYILHKSQYVDSLLAHDNLSTFKFSK